MSLNVMSETEEKVGFRFVTYLHNLIRAYQELLYNLVDMEGSSNPDIKEAGRVLKASVFYEPEYRELCLQQLSSYNPDRLENLSSLISVLFFKLMQNVSRISDRLDFYHPRVLKVDGAHEQEQTSDS